MDLMAVGAGDMIKLNKQTGSWEHRVVQQTVSLENYLSLACHIQKLSNH